ncbi:hypothetical protein cyc_02211 [Cyclospora cayetanensis]|uniref:Uncharacterized protein n=1 Tax=Cyclospora cayetanensis TaxID=88456 RepID=A0A1D3D1R8_9EIME|nr:hypothetical protein cyc_02211 [Cyclospora cayetanensis]
MHPFSPCGNPQVLPALPAPVEGRVGYRNKCEFTIGLTRKQQGQPLELQADEEEQTTPCVGFVCGVQRMQPQVAPPSGLLLLNHGMQEAARAMEERGREVPSRLSGLSFRPPLAVCPSRCQGPPICPLNSAQRTVSQPKQQLHVVTCCFLDAALTPQIRPFESESQESAHARSELIQSVVAAFGGRTFGDYKVTSIYLQENSALSDSVEGHPMEKIYGSDVLEQRLFDLHFRLGPSSFFQMVEAAVMDARRNARLNGLEKDVHFIAGKAEDVLPGLLEEFSAETYISAVVDPPRMGLRHLEQALPWLPGDSRANASLLLLGGCRSCRGAQAAHHYWRCGICMSDRFSFADPQVLKALKQCKQLEKLVYVSCNCKTLAENVLENLSERANLVLRIGMFSVACCHFLQHLWQMCFLCHTRRLLSALPPPPFFFSLHRLSSEESDDPFVPIAALPVDMFPHTLHCEAVLLLARRSRAAATAAEYHSTKRDKLLKLTAVEPALATGEPFTPSDDEEDEETTHQGMEAAAGCTRENGDGSGPSTNKHAHPQHLPPAASSTTPIWQGANPLLD